MSIAAIDVHGHRTIVAQPNKAWSQAKIKRYDDMWTRKYLIVLAVIIVLASVGIYYGTRSEHDRMVAAQVDHEHEDALIRATNILAVEPANGAAKKVIRESGQIFVYLLAAQSTLSDFSAESISSDVFRYAAAAMTRVLCPSSMIFLART